MTGSYRSSPERAAEQRVEQDAPASAHPNTAFFVPDAEPIHDNIPSVEPSGATMASRCRPSLEDRFIRRRRESQASNMLGFQAHALKVLNRGTWQTLIE